MKRYFSYISLYLVIGILIGYFFDFKDFRTYIFIFNLVLVSGFLGLAVKNETLVKATLFLLLGILLVSFSIDSKVYNILDKKVDMIGKVVKLETKDDKARLLVEIISLDGEKIKRNNKVLLSLEDKDNKIKTDYIIKSRLTLKEPLHNKNPKMFNYKKYLLSKRIYAVGFVKADKIEVISKKQSILSTTRELFRDRVELTFSKNMSMGNAQLIKSIILGEDFLLKEDRDIYNNLGLAHILAVSGLHIGIISSFIYTGLRFLKMGKKVATIMTIVTIWIYGLLIYLPVSILRANIMVTVYFLSRILFLPYDYKNSIFLAMFICLILNPLNIINISFILSFMAVLSLAYINPILSIYLKKYGIRYHKVMAPIISVNIGLLPVLGYYFNQLQTLSLVSNLIVVPIIAVSLNLSVVSLIINGRLKVLNLLINTILDLENIILVGLNKLSFFNIGVKSPNFETIIFYYMVLFLILYKHKFKTVFNKFDKVIISNICICIILTSMDSIFAKKLEINFVDVGQGDFIFVRENGENYVLDTGGEVFDQYSIGENIVVPYLLKHDIKKLRGLFISHFHEDHAKAGKNILENYRVSNVYATYKAEDNYLYKNLAKYKKINILKSGDRMNLSKDLTFHILNPERAYKDSNENNLSMVILMTYKGKKLIFTGDIESKIEEKLLSLDKIENIDLLKVAHHGSKTSSTQEFLDWVNPKISVFTVGKNNRYKHPDSEVVQRNKNQIFRTDLDGHIKIIICKDKIYTKTYEDKIIISLDDLIYLNIYTLLIIYILSKEKEKYMLL